MKIFQGTSVVDRFQRGQYQYPSCSSDIDYGKFRHPLRTMEFKLNKLKIVSIAILNRGVPGSHI